jgi:RNA recognition motif-containing protein
VLQRYTSIDNQAQQMAELRQRVEELENENERLRNELESVALAAEIGRMTDEGKDAEEWKTVWVGNIPSKLADEADAGDRIGMLFAGCGPVVSTTVRNKNGINRSWGLVSFATTAAAQAALALVVTVRGDAGEQVKLHVQLKQQKQTGGALSLIEQQHENETIARTRFSRNMLDVFQFRETARNSLELVGFIIYKLSLIVEADHVWAFYVR